MIHVQVIERQAFTNLIFLCSTCKSTAMAGDDENAAQNAATTSAANAKDRLAQVTSHIAPNTPKRRRKKGADADLPADYSDILGHIATLRKIASTPDTNNRG
jgi:hypothetical protein